MVHGFLYNEKEKRWDTDWGWVRFSGEGNLKVEVYGPHAPDWFNMDKAVETAALFAKFSPDSTVQSLVVSAIHEQYSAWLGMQTITRTMKKELRGGDTDG